MATTSSHALPLTHRPAWTALQAHYRQLKDTHLRTLFADDPTRGERLTAEAAGLFLDYSKQRITAETMRLLIELAEQSGLAERIAAMFAGQKINTTERRAVLHVALRMPRNRSLILDERDVVADVHEVLDRMAAFAGRVRGRSVRSVRRPRAPPVPRRSI